MKSILLTQCLQSDFVAPLGPWDAMPFLLHISQAIALVRQHRSPRALEAQSQIDRVWELARTLV
jgi:hypothetical protein